MALAMLLVSPVRYQALARVDLEQAPGIVVRS
jgi:hypothetical protein